MKKISILSLALVLLLSACEKKEYHVPVPKDELQIDALKRKLGPNIIGDSIDFVYAIALPSAKGKIVAAQVQASIAGAAATYIDPKSYYTNTSGVDVGITVAGASVNEGNTTSVILTKDTNAVAFRYYYSIPEEARGKEVSFTFSAKSSNGETVSYKLGPCKISKMDIAKNITVSDADKMYFSIADMAAYTAAEIGSNTSKVDLVYLYRSYTTGAFNHALSAPTASDYLPGVTLPSGVNNNTKLYEVFGLQDRNLANLQYGIYVDDIDLIEKDFSKAANNAIDLKAESGIWVETADKKYRAYIFINSINNTAKSAVISIKRLTMN